MGVSKDDQRRSIEITAPFDPKKYSSVQDLTNRGFYNFWMQREPLRVALDLFARTKSPAFQSQAQKLIADIVSDPLLGSTITELNRQEIDFPAISGAAVRPANLVDIAATQGRLSQDYPEIFAEAVQVAKEATGNDPATAMANAALFNQLPITDGMISNTLSPYMIVVVDIRANEKKASQELSALMREGRDKLNLSDEQRDAKISMWKKYLIPAFYDVHLAHQAHDATLVFSDAVKHILPRKPLESRSTIECKRHLADYIRTCGNGTLALVDEQS